MVLDIADLQVDHGLIALEGRVLRGHTERVVGERLGEAINHHVELQSPVPAAHDEQERHF